MRTCLLVGAWLVLPALAAYQNSFDVPFVFDDVPAIADESGARPPDRPGAWWQSRPDVGETTSGRPVVALTLALNHALSGERVWSYHALNLLVHILAGLALFGMMQRTLGQPGLRSRFGSTAVSLGIASAALWLLHPLQTESVTYTVQRAESLMGLFFLLTLFTFIRATQSALPRRWLALSLTACLLGMATKEVMVAAPLVVLLYDRTFVSGTFLEAWRRRRIYYLALAGTWLVLAVLVAGTQGRGGTAGFDSVVSPWHYLLTQCHALTHYLRLTVWPTPLVFDYGTAVIRHPGDVFVPAAILIALAAATGWAVVRKSPWGFAGFWFFATMAPSSSIVPVASQTMAEHRMYLSLAAPIVIVVVSLQRTLGRAGIAACLLIAAAAGFLTAGRNSVYGSAISIWSDTVAKRPENPRAQHNLGRAYFEAGRFDDARRHFELALQRRPGMPETHYNLGLCLSRLGRLDDAIRHYEQALAIEPADARIQNNLGNTLLARGKSAEARACYEAAIRLRPGFADAHANLGNVLLELGDPVGALRACEVALRLKPDNAAARFNAGNACAATGRFREAQSHYEAALRLKPDHAAAHSNFANVLLELDLPDTAIVHLNQALGLQPDFLAARRTLALLLMVLHRPAEALPHLEALSHALPGNPEIDRALREARAALKS